LIKLTAENGQIWRNIVTPEVSKVAETLAEFRGRYKYNLLDENVRRFNAEVPANLAVGRSRSDHNWSDSKDLSGDPRYAEKDVPRLISHGARVS
jgi:alkaline phosphatase D